jgi:glyoxylase-like metal-dependent hydrolase (beta-lactamase superfamily II)
MSLKVHHLSCGTMCPRGAYFVHGHGSPFARARIVCHVLLVETRDGLALVDTGIGSRDVRDPGRLGAGFLRRSAPRLDEAEPALAQLQALGFRPEDVRHLLPTHLDVDHAGGLPDFPDARVHVMRRELDAIAGTSDERYRPAHFAHGPRWSPYDDAGESWFGFDAVRPLVEGEDDVLLVPLFGHTQGLAGVAVRTARGWLLHAGDAYYSHLEMRSPNPRTPLGLELFQRRVSFDDGARRRNQRRLRELVRDHAGEVTVVSAHCATEYDRSRADARGVGVAQSFRKSPRDNPPSCDGTPFRRSSPPP